MHEPKGRYLPLAGPRRFIGDLVYFARQIPSAPVSRLFDVTPLVAPRASHSARPSWACLFMKAYAIVGADTAPLRRSLLQFPWPRLYEHPWMNCALAIERSYQGEEGVFVGTFRAPEHQSLVQLQQAVAWYKNECRKSGLLSHGTALQPGTHADPPALVVGDSERLGLQALQAVRHVRAIELRFAGAEQIHPISPLTTTLTYGPIDPVTGRVVVKLIYDHRVLDGAYMVQAP